jgi:hemoglobin
MRSTKKEIENGEDVRLLLDSFYAKVKEDPLLAPVFKSRIPTESDWPEHMDILYQFWESVLFGVAAFRGNPFPKHIGLGINATHFDRWIRLFHSTIDELFVGKIAGEAKDKSIKMRMLFEYKLKSIDESGNKPLV